MLSTEQKKLRDQANRNGALKTKSGLCVRLMDRKNDYDLSRVKEIWANLTMIQQMKGNSHWLDQSNASGKGWNDFLADLFNKRYTRVIVFENEEMIFGFSYISISAMNAQNAKQKTALKATINELYYEPAFKTKVDPAELSELMKNILAKLNIEYIEFAVQDLDI